MTFYYPKQIQMVLQTFRFKQNNCPNEPPPQNSLQCIVTVISHEKLRIILSLKNDQIDLKCSKFITAGDFSQLPPVNDNWQGDCENSPAMHSLRDGQRSKLKTCRRSDRKLFDLCRSVQRINTKQFQPSQDTYLNLAYAHDTRIKINNQCMKRYLGSNPGIVILKAKKNPKTQNVTLSKSMTIIAHTRNKQMNILNC